MDSNHRAVIRKRLTEYDLSVDFHAGSNGQEFADLAFNGLQQTFSVIVLPNARLSELEEHQFHDGNRHIPLFIFSPYINSRRAQVFHKLNINYLDSAGNIYLRFGSVLIHVQGNNAVSSNTTANATRRSINLFSPKRMQVIFALLSWPELQNATLRDISEASHVSLGQAQSTLSLLEQQDYILIHENGSRKLTHGRQLAHQWALAFKSALAPKLKERAVSGDIQNYSANSDTPVFVSGESAVQELLRPTTLLLYTERANIDRLVIQNRWPSSSSPNIMVREQFWTAPETLTTDKPTVAPWLLVYADLLSSQEPRQLESARLLESAHEI